MPRRGAIVVLLSILLVPAALLAASPDQAAGRLVSYKALANGDAVMTVRTGPGQRAHGPMYDTPPAAPSEELEEEFEADAQLPTPIRDSGILILPEQDVETDPDSMPRPEVPGSAIVYRNSVLAPPATFSSNVNEPSVGSQGDALFTTHNWYAAVSTDNGSTYSYISPYTLFPNTPSTYTAGFCCDQRVAQDSSRDLVFWYLQYVKSGSTSGSTGGSRIAVAHGAADLASNTWTYYNLTPALFSLGNNRWFDFPHMQVSANYLYFTTNIFAATNNAFVGALVGRIPLSQLAAGGSVTIDAFTTSAYGSIMAVNGAGAEGTRAGRTTMYFAALDTTTSARVLTWPEANTSPTVTSVTGLATTTSTTYVCTGPDSLDPCTRANVRMQTGWITDTELGLMWTSAQNSAAGRPYPYTKVAILNPSTLAIVSQPDIWSSSYAWLYPAVAINERGHLGGTIDALGGTLFPTVRALIRDDLSPDVTTSGWETVDVSASTHGTAGLWGDYNGAATHEQYPVTWLGVGHTQNGGSGNANSQPRNFWLMRERDVPHHTLTVSKAGDGTGTVSSSPSGISCGADCSESYEIATNVTLTATPDAGMTFSGWSGDCTGTGSCVVKMTKARAVTATFVRSTYNLNVALAGAGAGSVSSSPAGINCGADCSETYNTGTSVTLTATPATGSVFTGWSGACTGTGTCILSMTADRSVTATFSVATYTLSVSLAGAGSGSVSSSPAGIDCGADCSEVYSYNTMVTLSATPATGSVFGGWSGACTGTGSCVVTMDQARSVTATFSIATYTLSVSLAGAGSGSVSSSPSGIDCGADCSETYNYNTMVTLTATPATGSVFDGWSGACTGTGSCVVTMDQARSVTATFSIATYTLSVSLAGAGSGAVTSSPSGIDCGSDCSETYNYNTSVTLTATPATGSVFDSWSGACTGTGSCVVTMDQARSVTATFSIATHTLSVSLAGAGSGAVTSSPAGINCGSDCSETYNYNTSVTLAATPATGSVFGGWSGACTGTGSCVVTMDQARSVTATFSIATHTLSVSLAGAGSGAVTSSPAGIDCGSDCSETYNYNTTVTLTAAPATGSVFDGWSGACTGTGSCVVTMDQARSVTATFSVATYTLSVSLTGAGSGSVTSSPAGIDCGSDCSESYDYNTEVTLTATPATGVTFNGWSGACSGTGSCVVTMNQARSVTAMFSVSTYTLSVSLAGAGSGTVSSSPAGIDCGSDCTESYNYNTVVTLTATPATGSVFDGWSGACTGTGSCVVTVNQMRSVTATFSIATYPLSVSLAGAGSGSVNSSPAGIDCGSDCSETYNYNTMVMLTATPVTGSVFGGWGGACTGTGTCVVTMTEARSVTATFEVGSFVLTVARAGDGAGTVTSSPSGIDCGSDCSESYSYNTLVTLTATAGTRSVFTGWSGACTGAGSCQVTMSQAKSVTATFNDTGLDFYTLAPCRVISPTTLTSGVSQVFNVAGVCGVPADAKAVSLNVTAVNATSNGNLRLYPGDGSVPSTSALNFQTGVNRANNAIIQLATNGDGTLGAAAFLSTGSDNMGVIVDVNGYYKRP